MKRLNYMSWVCRSSEEGIVLTGTRLFRWVSVLWRCAFAGCVFCATPAQALTVYVSGGSFGGAGFAPGESNHPRRIAVNETSPKE
jgi:hypothetical protein